LGALGTAATNRPIVPAPGDYDDGEFGEMMIGRGNRSTRRKPASVSICPSQSRHMSGSAEKNTQKKTSVKISGMLVDIRKTHFLRTAKSVTASPTCSVL
jgi:hypothetical protein